MKYIEEALKKIIEVRKNPIMLLNLKVVDKYCALQIHKEINKNNKFKELDVILQTGGGDIDSAYLIIKILKKSTDKLNIIIPLYSKSAGTLICLGADNLLLTSLSELGPLDTQIRESDRHKFKSALNEFKALERIQLHSLETLDITSQTLMGIAQSVELPLKITDAIYMSIKHTGNTSGSLYNKLDPYRIGECARALEVGVKYGTKILTKFMGWKNEVALEIIKKLVYGYPSHGYVIDIEELNALKLPVSEIKNADESYKPIMKFRDLLLDKSETIIKLIKNNEIDEKNTDISNTNAPIKEDVILKKLSNK